MCTVTFIREGDSYFLTSNRDEKVQRSQALPPTIYHRSGTNLLYPRDADAGGSWIALKENLTTAVLLNGAYVNHSPQPPYRLSRGIVLLDILASPEPFNHFKQMNLAGIEPFTLVLLEDWLLYEGRWDGTKKYHQQLTTSKHYIWSSATLYDAAVQQKRATWFRDWQKKNLTPTIPAIFQFHQFAGDGDEENDIRMNREGQLNTVSITGVHLTKLTGSMHYLDLKDGATYLRQVSLNTPYVI